MCCEKCKTEGLHKGHNVLSLDDSKGFIKENLEKSVNFIKSSSATLSNIPKRAEEFMKMAQIKREQAKEVIKHEFEDVRRILNKKEAELLKAIDSDAMNDVRFNRLISYSQTLISSLSSSTEAGQALLNEWDTVNLTSEAISKVISSVNKTKEIVYVKDAFEDMCYREVSVETSGLVSEAKKVLDTISSIKNVFVKRDLPTGPSGLVAKCVGPFFVSLEWDRCELDHGYFIALQKEGEAWDSSTSLKSTENRLTVAHLQPDVVYNFSIQAVRGNITSRWSKPFVLKTAPLTLQSAIVSLNSNMDNDEICVDVLKGLNRLVKDSNIYTFVRSTIFNDAQKKQLRTE